VIFPNSKINLIAKRLFYEKENFLQEAQDKLKLFGME